MTSNGLALAREKMAQAGVDQLAIDVFSYYYHRLEHGDTGMMPEATIDPLDMPALADVEVSEQEAADAIAKTVVIKLNGG
ncbi:MAG TPA: UTP--glucose-1-phosphate uridylyltransferase, partial [Marmoricola sp.]|nr:UTP--glucose-1-phosphate uridylyltransferase [Marmoricola sp.]